MRSKLQKILIASALCAAVSSCDSRVETHLAFPPVTDLQVDPEPAYPEAALEPGPAGEQAEREWVNSVLTWGRDHKDRVARVCIWARDLGLAMPKDYCSR